MIDNQIDKFREEFGSAKRNLQSLMVDDWRLTKIGERFHAAKGNHRWLMVNDQGST
jgi:hypothetical protein